MPYTGRYTEGVTGRYCPDFPPRFGFIEACSMTGLPDKGSMCLLFRNDPVAISYNIAGDNTHT